MTALRAVLVIILATVATYTAMAGANHGWNPLPLFFSSIAGLTWPGQFNLDLIAYLALSAIWIAWRHRFSAAGIALGGAAFLGGSIFLTLYLLWASGQSGGDARTLLMGKSRMAR